MSLSENKEKLQTLWAEITQTPRPFRTCKIKARGIEREAAIWVLTQQEAILINARVARKTREMLIKIMGEMPKQNELAEEYIRVFELYATAETLFNAVRDVEDLNRPFFNSAEEIVKHMTIDETAVAYQQYKFARLELGPIIHEMPESEVDAWVDRLVAAGNTLPLAAMSSEALNQLVLTLAYRTQKLPTDIA